MFDESSTCPLSPIFTVRPGEVVVLSSYGLRERQGQVAGVGCVDGDADV